MAAGHVVLACLLIVVSLQKMKLVVSWAVEQWRRPRVFQQKIRVAGEASLESSRRNWEFDNNTDVL